MMAVTVLAVPAAQALPLIVAAWVTTAVLMVRADRVA
jgi:hypothetical protein